MNGGSVKKGLIGSATAFASVAAVYLVVVVHNAWGDERYQQKSEAIRSEISILDNALDVVGIEILFASGREKEKFETIEASYERKKKALSDKLEKL